MAKMIKLGSKPLEKVWPIFSSLNAIPGKILLQKCYGECSPVKFNLFDILFITLQEHFVYG